MIISTMRVISVATAAPITPSRGKPSRPKISSAFSPMFKNNATTVVTNVILTTSIDRSMPISAVVIA